MPTALARPSAFPVRALITVMRSRWRRLLALAALATLAACPPRADAAVGQLFAPANFRPKDFCIVKADSIYHAFYIMTDATCDGYVDAKQMGHSISRNLIDWTFVDVALDSTDNAIGSNGYWAPSVVQQGGLYFLFFTCLSGNVQRMGVVTTSALSKTPGGTVWSTPSEVITCSNLTGCGAPWAFCGANQDLRDPFVMASPFTTGPNTGWLAYYVARKSNNVCVGMANAPANNPMTWTDRGFIGSTWFPNQPLPHGDGANGAPDDDAPNTESPCLVQYAGTWYMFLTDGNADDIQHGSIRYLTSTDPTGDLCATTGPFTWTFRGSTFPATHPWEFASEVFQEPYGDGARDDYWAAVRDADCPAPFPDNTRRILIREMRWLPGQTPPFRLIDPLQVTALSITSGPVVGGNNATLTLTAANTDGELRAAHLDVFEVDGATRTPISPQSVGLPSVVSIPSNGQPVNVTFKTRFFADDDATPNQLEIVVRFRGIETPTPLQISMPPAFHGNWTAITVDNTGTDTGAQTSIALNGVLPSIAYDVLDGTGKLRVASWNGSNWAFLDAETNGVDQFFNPSLALDGTGLPRVAYMVTGDYDLKYASYNGSSWSYDPLIDTPGMTGFDCSLVLYNGVPRIAYQDRTNADLKYAYKTGSTWTVTTVESNGNTGLIPSLALDASGNPRIAYHEGNGYDLKYASWNGSQWTFEKIDSNGVVGGYASLQLDGAGNPRIAYLDASNHDVKYAEKNGSTWSVEAVDLVGSVGQYCALALDPLGNPRISYWDGTNGDLKMASRGSGGWTIETVDAGGSVGSWTSIAIGPNGDPHISYYDIANTSLKYATAAANDYIPPAASTIGVAVGRTLAVVSWTSPGDDLNYGTATQYDLRYSSSPINDGNFAFQQQASTPAPSPAGNGECAEIGGLLSCTTYYFALKTADEVGNWSAISNLPSMKTKCSGFSIPECSIFSAKPARAEEGGDEPASMAFAPAQPNPAHDEMTLHYEIPRVAPGTSFEIAVYDVAGRRVREVARGMAQPGRYSEAWDLRGEDGTRVRHGMYFVRFRLGSEVMNRTAVVLR